MPDRIRIVEACKNFGDLKALNKVSLSVKSGETVVVIGPSGSGKSTLLRSVNRLEVLTSGDIWIDEDHVTSRNADIRRIREEVGMVFQSFNLFPHKTLFENVMMAPMVVKGVSKDEAAANAERLLKKVGLGERLDLYPINLSGGQQQRGAIARALAMAPKVMLYDEPTSALDPSLVDEVLDVMKELDREGMTQIVVTHEMRFARDASDYIVYMEAGEIIEISDEDEIFENPKDPRTRQFLRRFA